MSEFLHLLPPPEALATFLEAMLAAPQVETIPTIEALHRVTFAPIIAPFSLPSFARSTVDGYAVRAQDTYGASESLPAYLHMVGEVDMGTMPTFQLEVGQCALIHTGGMLPQGADAIIMVEHTQASQPHEIECLKTVAHGENVLQTGEDVNKGETVIKAGARLRPAEIGGLMALGLSEVTVCQQPRVGILSSGDEVIPPTQPLSLGQVYDVNSYTLRALIIEAGGIPNLYDIIPDEINAFQSAAERALAENDLLIFTAGSSVSVRDLTAQTINHLGRPGVLVHGVNVRPGKPTILAICNGKGVIGLPGNPVSALVIAGIFVVPTIKKLLGITKRTLQTTISASLTTNLSSQAGREDWISVQLHQKGSKYVAQPIFGKSNLIFTLAKADGLLCIPAPATGLSNGEQVTIHLL